MDNFDLRKYLAEGRLLKENIDYSSIKGEMKKMYDIDVDLDTIKDFVTSYDDGEGMDIFDTTEREDFYLYLKDEGRLLTLDEGRMKDPSRSIKMGKYPQVSSDTPVPMNVKYLTTNGEKLTMKVQAKNRKEAVDAVKSKDSNFKAEIKTDFVYDKDGNKLLKEDQASDLINDGVVLYISDDSKLAPGFVEPKKIGFIVYNTAVKDTSKSILSITGNLSKNKKVIDIFNDNYPNTDPNYTSTFFTNPKNWKAINSEDELNSFMSKYSKVYLINHNGDSSELNEAFNPFLDTEEGGYMREYIDDAAGEEGLDLEYRNEFDEAFDLALTKLRKDHSELDFNLIVQNKESFF